MLSPDVPLYDAMLCWDRRDRTAKIIRHPDTRDASAPYASSAGACYTDWRDKPELGRKLQFMIDLWHIVAFDNIPHDVAHQAALVVPEYRDMLARDCLPEDYQHERD
jgi:hypothetical protein